jgi:hypothetical protein
LLIEQSSVNLVLQSTFQSGWSGGAAAGTLTANQLLSPNGTVNAAQYVESTAASSFHYKAQNVTKAASALVYTFSVFLKASGNRQVGLRMQDTGGTNGAVVTCDPVAGTIATAGVYGTFTSASATIKTIGNGWYRFSLTATSSTDTLLTLQLETLNAGTSVYTGDGVSGFYCFGAQLEQLSYLTSYIATTSAAATRAVDSAQLPVGSWFNSSAGTLTAAFYSNLLSSTYITYNWAIAGFYGSASDNNNLMDLFSGSGYGSVFRVRTNAVGQAYVIASGSPYQNQSNNKTAATYGTNGFVEIVNGNSTYLGSAATATIPTVSYLDIGTRNTGGVVPGVMWIKLVTYYPAQLSNSEIQSITSDY